MIYWIKKISKLMALSVFLLVLFSGINYRDPFNGYYLFPAVIKAFLAGISFWFVGFIIFDIIFKGILEDIPADNIDILDGGIVQRIKQRSAKNPFEGDNIDGKSSLKDSKKSKKLKK